MSHRIMIVEHDPMILISSAVRNSMWNKLLNKLSKSLRPKIGEIFFIYPLDNRGISV